jgi:hypothetical protein
LIEGVCCGDEWLGEMNNEICGVIEEELGSVEK